MDDVGLCDKSKINVLDIFIQTIQSVAISLIYLDRWWEII